MNRPWTLGQDKSAIWVGKYRDQQGEFEILVIASNRTEADLKVKDALNQIMTNPQRVVTADRIIGEPTLLFVAEVGDFDMVRPK